MLSENVPFIRLTAGERAPSAAAIPRESPLTIEVDDVEVVTLRCSPVRLNTLVFGFLFNEGIIEHRDDVALLRVCDQETLALVRLAQPKDLAALTRRRTLGSGCGAGVTFRREEEGIPAVPETRRYAVRAVLEAMARLSREMNVAGGLHVASLTDGAGLFLRSVDVARHNTLDKLAGECLLGDIDSRGLLLLTTGRISSEMVWKCARMGVEVVASRHSPTDRAVSLARTAGLTLCGHVSAGGLNAYCGEERLSLD